MDYSSINSFLEKFKNTLFKKEAIYIDIVDIVFENIGVSLNINDIKIVGTEIRVKCSPAAKNELLINKDKILELLRNKQPNNIFTNIS